VCHDPEVMRAVLFDLDDTLVDQRTAARVAVVGWAAGLGIADADVAQRWARISTRCYALYQSRELTFTQQRRERVREFLDAPLTDQQADALFADYLERYEAGWAVFEDAVPAVRRARAVGLPVVVLTNGEENQQRRKLGRLGLAHEIDLLVASSMMPAGKPDPRAFRHAVDLIGVDAGEAMMVGDSLPIDVLGAQAAGLRAVLVDRADAHADTDVPRVRSLSELAFTS
jgi:putative hydrolase of the HAD superfamily